MTDKTDHRTAAARDIMFGLTWLAKDTLRKMNKTESDAIWNGLESGTHVLQFGVSIAGRDTVIAGKVTELASGAHIDIPELHVRLTGGEVVAH